MADFQRELEAYTGRSWQAFFDNWLYGKGMTDWSVEKVQIEEWSDAQRQMASGRAGSRSTSIRDFLAAVKGEPAPGRIRSAAA